MWNALVLCNAGSRKGSYTVIETAPVRCLAGDRLCSGLEFPYLALPQMPEAGALSALPPAGRVPPPQSRLTSCSPTRENKYLVRSPAFSFSAPGTRGLWSSFHNSGSLSTCQLGFLFASLTVFSFWLSLKPSG